MWPARLRRAACLALESRLCPSTQGCACPNTAAAPVFARGLVAAAQAGLRGPQQRGGDGAAARDELSLSGATSPGPGGSVGEQMLRQMGPQMRCYAAAAGGALPQTSSPPGLADEPELPIADSSGKLHYPQQQNPPREPWTPTRELAKRNFLPRRMGHLIQALEREREADAKARTKHPDFRPGDVLELKLAVPENQGRPATFRGLCIARRNRGIRTSFTLRNHLGTAGGVERSFPLYSPTIQSIRVLERRRVRRAKLYYLRGRNPKEYRVS